MNDLALDMQLCFPLYAASNLLTRRYRSVLEPLELTYPQYLVMLVLWESAPQSIGGIGEKLHLDSGTLTPLIKRLVANGLVSRNRDQADDRRVLVSLTEKGQALRTAAANIPRSFVEELQIDQDELKHLRDALKRFVQGLTVRANQIGDGKDSKS
ncbi:MarR family winged helix-turn-helix transcriptional regulator [Sulfitobacter aestuarii]|uniref:MarR family winged helix-turn-helix transcriptional regulator n=1 Tax=Sulfitobacter aestuarii TaxID=2161676 RepID=A0ABW5U597_9RHOB